MTLRTCALTKDEFNFFKKNPHCLGSVCSLDRIGERSDFFLKYIDNSEDPIDSTGFVTKITLDDVTRPRRTYEVIDQLVPAATSQMDPLSYHRNGQRPNTTAHLGQLKLFLSTLQFLLKYSDKSTITHVVYPGSAPGNSIDFLTMLFPHCRWWLYDPRDIFDKKLYTNNKIKKIVIDFFLDEHIEEIQNSIEPGEKLLLFSDIRVCEEVLEDLVERDMRLQESWVRKLKPDHAMLKFRLPRDLGEDYTYLDGEIYLQMFAPTASTETRLVVDGKNIKTTEYNVDFYEGLMYFFNRRARMLSYTRDSCNVESFDSCHDCVASLNLLDEYIHKYNKTIDACALMNGIIRKVSKDRKLFEINNKTLQGMTRRTWRRPM